MDKEEAYLIMKGVLMFYELNTKSYIKEQLDLSDEQVELSSRLFKVLRFTPIEQLKQGNFN